MQNKLNVRAITLYDKEDMVIGTLIFFNPAKLPWMPSNDILLFDGDGYRSDAGYSVNINVVGKESKTGIRVYIDGQGFNAYVKAYSRTNSSPSKD